VIPWESKLRQGCRVRIKEGPLAGLAGILDRPTSRAERVCVLLNLLNTVATVEVDVVDLEEVHG
jgi:transcription antitermination factor NusG